MMATGIIAKSQTTLTEKELNAYAKAGAVAEEVQCIFITTIYCHEIRIIKICRE